VAPVQIRDRSSTPLKNDGRDLNGQADLLGDRPRRTATSKTRQAASTGRHPTKNCSASSTTFERPVGTYLYGRRMYETMLYWETALTVPGQPSSVREFRRHLAGSREDRIFEDLNGGAERQDATRTNFDPGIVGQLKSATEHDMTWGCGDWRPGHQGRDWWTNCSCSWFPSSWEAASERSPTASIPIWRYWTRNGSLAVLSTSGTGPRQRDHLGRRRCRLRPARSARSTPSAPTTPAGPAYHVAGPAPVGPPARRPAVSWAPSASLVGRVPVRPPEGFPHRDLLVVDGLQRAGGTPHCLPGRGRGVGWLAVIELTTILRCAYGWSATVRRERDAGPRSCPASFAAGPAEPFGCGHHPARAKAPPPASDGRLISRGPSLCRG
jgi:hypothetical protein